MEDQILLKYNISEVKSTCLTISFYTNFPPARLQPLRGGCSPLQTVQSRDAVAVCWLLLLCHHSPHNDRSASLTSERRERKGMLEFLYIKGQ